MKSGILMYHIKLVKSDSDRFIGKWNIFMIDELKSQTFYLSIENGSGDDYEAYPFFRDDRFTGTWCYGFQKKKDTISFADFKTGLQFRGYLASSKIVLDIHIGGGLVSQLELRESKEDWKFGGFDSEKETDYPVSKAIGRYELLTEMEDSVKSNFFENTHSVLIAKKGNLVYEKYFSGYNSAISHDQRSASKSISSAIIGLAIDKNLIKSTKQSLYEFLPDKYQYTLDSLKSNISIHSLLTMSSGLDAVDFGIDRKSVASEDNYQPTPDWTKTILEAPMINKPNTHANYGSANPHLLGVVASSVTDEPLELFMDRHLFQKLEISNYIIQTDEAGSPYFGGGMYLIPRDMVKFGQLYLNEGTWENERVLSKDWVRKSHQNYMILENTSDKNGYGYLWWHKTYQVNGREIESIEARGAGGQYIFLIKELDLVVVITSGNFRNGKTQQPEQILEQYILPAILK